MIKHYFPAGHPVLPDSGADEGRQALRLAAVHGAAAHRTKGFSGKRAALPGGFGNEIKGGVRKLERLPIHDRRMICLVIVLIQKLGFDAL